jgi:hypothetical protein
MVSADSGSGASADQFAGWDTLNLKNEVEVGFMETH